LCRKSKTSPRFASPSVLTLATTDDRKGGLRGPEEALTHRFAVPPLPRGEGCFLVISALSGRKREEKGEGAAGCGTDKSVPFV
jgi:hypothetical protein